METTPPLLDQFVAYLTDERGLARGSAETYTEGLGRLHAFTGKDPTTGVQLPTNDVRAYLRKSPHSRHTKHSTLSAIKSWERWRSVEDESYQTNGILSLTAPVGRSRPRSPLSTRQVTELIVEARGQAELRLVFYGLHGCRIGESSSMKPANWLDDRLRFGNKGRKRDLPLSAELIALRGTLSEPRVVSDDMLQTACEALRERVGFHFTGHSLRRTFAQTLLDRGVPLEIVESLMGHAPSSMTLKAYAAIPWRQKVAAIELLSY